VDGLPLKVTFAVALAASLLFTLDWKSIFDLVPLGAFTRPILIVIAVIFWTLTIVGVIDNLLAPVRERRRQEVLSTRRAVRQKEARGAAGRPARGGAGSPRSSIGRRDTLYSRQLEEGVAYVLHVCSQSPGRYARRERTRLDPR
jgi:hypothetical protein